MPAMSIFMFCFQLPLLALGLRSTMTDGRLGNDSLEEHQNTSENINDSLVQLWLHHQTYLVANMSFLPALNLWRAWQNTGIGKVFKKLRHC